MGEIIPENYILITKTIPKLQKHVIWKNVSILEKIRQVDENIKKRYPICKNFPRVEKLRTTSRPFFYGSIPKPKKNVQILGELSQGIWKFFQDLQSLGGVRLNLRIIDFSVPPPVKWAQRTDLLYVDIAAECKDIDFKWVSLENKQYFSIGNPFLITYRSGEHFIKQIVTKKNNL